MKRNGGFALTAQLLAPVIAVGVFWMGMHSAWLTILAYHAQMAIWLLVTRAERPSLRLSKAAWLALPAALVGPATYLLLPSITLLPVSAWFSQHGLTGFALAAMVPYYGLVHPPLEQVYWARLREQTPLAHVLFAGYHLLVLASLLPAWALLAVFAALAGSSVMWGGLQRRTGSLAVPVLQHTLADAGMVIAAVLLVR